MDFFKKSAIKISISIFTNFRQQWTYEETENVFNIILYEKTEIKGSGRKFEHTRVWGWSGDGLIRGEFGLKSLIIGGFQRTWVWSEATSSALGSDHNVFERPLIWPEMTWSVIGSDHNLFERIWVWCDQTRFRTQMCLIRDISCALFFFSFFLRDVGSAKKQQWSSVLIRD